LGNNELKTPEEKEKFLDTKLTSVLNLNGKAKDKFIGMIKSGEITGVNFQSSYDAVVTFKDGEQQLVDDSNVVGRGI
jgi:hypothetical protein